MIEPTSLVSPALAGWFFTTSATWEALSVKDQTANVVGFVGHYGQSWLLSSVSDFVKAALEDIFKSGHACVLRKFDMHPGLWIAHTLHISLNIKFLSMILKCKHCLAVPRKVKHRIATGPSNSTPGFKPKITESSHMKDTCGPKFRAVSLAIARR